MEKEWEPKAASSYTLEEKAKAFDQLHAMAMDAYEYVKEYHRGQKDGDHFIYEEVMKLCLGNHVFNAYNKLAYEG